MFIIKKQSPCHSLGAYCVDNMSLVHGLVWLSLTKLSRSKYQKYPHFKMKTLRKRKVKSLSMISYPSVQPGGKLAAWLQDQVSCSALSTMLDCFPHLGAKGKHKWALKKTFFYIFQLLLLSFQWSVWLTVSRRIIKLSDWIPPRLIDQFELNCID